MTDKRPKLNIPKTIFERVADGAAVGAFVWIVAYLVSVWGILPEEIPAHFNGAGEADRWGSRWELLILPVIAAMLWTGMTFLEQHPEWHNYMTELHEGNIEFQYRNSRMMLNVLKNLIVHTFVYLSYRLTQMALGEADDLGMMFVPIFLVLMIASMIIFIVRSLRNR